jgi:hypothetical protein
MATQTIPRALLAADSTIVAVVVVVFISAKWKGNQALSLISDLC